MPLTDTQWAVAVAGVIADVAAGSMTEVQAAEALTAATLDWPTRTLSNADLGARVVAFLARLDGVLVTAGPPADDLGEDGSYAFDGLNAELYGPKAGGAWGEPTISLVGPPGADGADGSDGTDGTNGTDGENGWTPVFAAVVDGARRVHQVIDWVGGEGTKPATGKYVGATGMVDAIADGVDVRGAAGADGSDGSDGTDGVDGTNGTNGTDGQDGWTPVLAMVVDGARRVQQVVDWVGGEGTKPATGKYVGATGLVDAIADGVDVRGAAGAGTGDVVGPGTHAADYLPQWNGTNSNTLKPGRPIGASAGGDIPDRDAADGRYRKLADALGLGDIIGLVSALADKLALAGGTMIGKLTLKNSFADNAAQLNIPDVGTTNPSGVVDGDVWGRSGSLWRRRGTQSLMVYDSANLPASSQAIAEAGTDAAPRIWTAQNVRQAIDAAPSVTGKVNKAGDTMTGRLKLHAFTEKAAGYSTGAVDTATGSVVDAGTINANVTVSFSNLPSSPATGDTVTVVLRATISGTPVITWPSGIVWAGATAPTLAAGAWEFVISARWTGSAWAYRGAWVRFF